MLKKWLDPRKFGRPCSLIHVSVLVVEIILMSKFGMFLASSQLFFMNLKKAGGG